MKRALVLGGGGARGAFQVGMLRSLVIDQGLDFQVIRGISVGALNASFLAQAETDGDSLLAMGNRVTALENLWRHEIRGDDSVYEHRPGGLIGLAAGGDSMYSLEPLKRLLKRHLSLDQLRKSGRDFKVGTVSLVHGTYAEWGPEDPQFVEKVLASASIPVVFPFVRNASLKEVLVDGGVRNITPLASAFDADPDEIYVLLTSRLVRNGPKLPDSGVQEQTYEEWVDNWLGSRVGGFDVLKRTVEILTDEIYLDDLRGALSWNGVLKSIPDVLKTANELGQLPAELTRALENLRRSTRKIAAPIYVLAPQQWHGPGNSATDFSPALIDAGIEHGRQIGADKSKWLWP